MIPETPSALDRNYRVTMDSGSLSFASAGQSDRTLLMLHGFSLRPGLYPLASELIHDFHIVIPDLPFSTKNDFHLSHTLDNYVGTLIELIQSLNLKNVSIFGNSIGGTLGLMCCITDPSLFNRLIIRCPLWTGAQLPNYMQVKGLVNLQQAFSGSKTLALAMLSIFYQMSARISPVDANRTENHSQSIYPYEADQINPRVFSRFLGHLTRTEITDQLEKISNETLVLWGAEDTFISSSWGAQLNAILPRSEFQVVPGEYHNLATIDTPTLAARMMDFLD